MKIRRLIAIIILGLPILLFSIKLLLDKPVPKGFTGKTADSLAQQIMNKVNIQAWDKLPAISFTFNGTHHYIWDKSNNLVQVSWDENRVLLNIEKKTGKVFQNKKLLTSDAAEKVIETAFRFWTKEVFWINPIANFFEEGVTRSVVKNEEGSHDLLIEIENEGLAPNDMYLWKFNSDGMPYEWQMWDAFLPIKGARASWENWQKIHYDIYIATFHKTVLYDIEITDIRTGNEVLKDKNGGYIFDIIINEKN